MNYIRTMLDELVEEGWVVCIQNVETGCLFYFAADNTAKPDITNYNPIDRTED